MTYRFVNRPEVKADLLDALEYYGKISPKLAKQFLFRVSEAKHYIALAPKSFQVKYQNVRTVRLRQFPYNLHYLFDEANLTIIVLAIIHGHKKPNDYSNR
jgi:plasmid stabilization system protein ParE